MCHHGRRASCAAEYMPYGDGMWTWVKCRLRQTEDRPVRPVDPVTPVDPIRPALKGDPMLSQCHISYLPHDEEPATTTVVEMHSARWQHPCTETRL